MILFFLQDRLAAGGGATGVRVLVGQPRRDLAELALRVPDVISDKEGTDLFVDGAFLVAGFTTGNRSRGCVGSVVG